MNAPLFRRQLATHACVLEMSFVPLEYMIDIRQAKPKVQSDGPNIGQSISYLTLCQMGRDKYVSPLFDMDFRNTIFIISNRIGWGRSMKYLKGPHVDKSSKVSPHYPRGLDDYV